MKLNVQKQGSSVGSIYKFALYAIVILGIGSTVLERISLTTSQRNLILGGVIALFITVALYKVSLSIYENFKISKRRRILTNIALSKHLLPDNGNTYFSASLTGISDDKSKFRNNRVENYFSNDEWSYGEYAFDQYEHSKNGTYNVATYYFAFTSFKLPRKLPNVFFDSSKTGGNEFKVLFNQSQKHSMESTFDNYFTTYFHEDYMIDSLSFITPEVMESLIQAGNYDIEIFQDQLILMSGLRDMPEQLEDMERKGRAIVQTLLNNITTYRDERIMFEDGRRTISALGLTLRKSKTRYHVGVAIGSLFLVLAGLYLLISPFFNAVPNANLTLYAIVAGVSILVSNLKKIKKINREDKEAKARVNQGV